MKVIRNLIAALALTLAIPTAAQAATITVTVGTTPAGDPAPFTFHVTGPPCNAAPTDLTFALSDGQSKVLTLCDSPADVAHRFHVTEEVPAGWRLTSIDCTSDDPDPADAFVIDIPTATALVELSASEDKACSFRNAKVPAPTPAPTPATPVATSPGATATPVPPSAAPPSSGVAPAAPPSSGVAGEQERSPVRATARIRAQARCAARTARVTVSGRLMRQVRFSVNGRRVRTVTAARGVRLVTALVPLRRTGPAVQTVRARVTFRNGAAPRTLTASVRRCTSARVAPQFTG
jgi:hypothetical protein